MPEFNKQLAGGAAMQSSCPFIGRNAANLITEETEQVPQKQNKTPLLCTTSQISSIFDGVPFVPMTSYIADILDDLE